MEINDRLYNSLGNKTIMIIGGTGSLGNALTKYLFQHHRIIIFSRDENKQWIMRRKYPQLVYVLGDVRDRVSIENAINLYNPNIIIVAAALKHIDQCEINIRESINTNILGIQNVIEVIKSPS